jgi:putative PIN family toxin of toxin-antitoxin system
MRAVLDTNVVVSGVVEARGFSARLLRESRIGRLQTVVSPALLAELERVLGYGRITKRTGWSSDQRREFVARYLDDSVFVDPPARLRITRDPDDNRVLEAAVAARADNIVTGDRDLLTLTQFEGIQILTPAQFVEEVLEQPGS